MLTTPVTVVAWEKFMNFRCANPTH
jgi:hypothetical protein